jgi:hypothetical protein
MITSPEPNEFFIFLSEVSVVRVFLLWLTDRGSGGCGWSLSMECGFESRWAGIEDGARLALDICLWERRVVGGAGFHHLITLDDDRAIPELFHEPHKGAVLELGIGFILDGVDKETGGTSQLVLL